MAQSIDYMAHASVAVARTGKSQDRLRAQIAADSPGMSQMHLANAGELLLELDRRHAKLVDAAGAMAEASPDTLPRLWRLFLWHYDRYLEGRREAKCTLAADEYVDGITASMVRSSAGLDELPEAKSIG